MLLGKVATLDLSSNSQLPQRQSKQHTDSKDLVFYCPLRFLAKQLKALGKPASIKHGKLSFLCSALEKSRVCVGDLNCLAQENAWLGSLILLTFPSSALCI